MNATAPTPPPARGRRLERLASGERFDVLVVGGGITGAGVALDLASRGLEVALVERADWGQETSSASSRLLHGGLRYLETYEFGLVRESCLERSLLLRNAAGLAWPERFTFPLFRGGRVGRLKLAAGLGLYTALSIPRVLGIPSLVGVKDTQLAVPGIAPGVIGAGQYLDGATDDARLAWSVVRSAIERGAVCASRVAATSIAQDRSGVEVRLADTLGASDVATAPELGTLRADHAVLCGGPFTEELRALAGLSGRWLSPTRGTHVVLPRHRLPTDGAVVFASAVDGRVMFVLPWPGHTIVGTTDVDAPVERRGNQQRGEASEAEVGYLLDSANGLVPGADLVRADVVSVWSGLRPLLAAPEENPSARSREERIQRDGAITTIAGGKLTGFRSMAEKLGAQLVRYLEREGPRPAARSREGTSRDGRRISPTRDLRLWGALDRQVARPAWSHAEPDAAGLREAALAGRYGRFAGAARTAAAEGPHAGRDPLDPQTSWADVAWAAEYEDALEPADVFVRRTDLGYTRPDVADLAADEIAGLLAAQRSG